MSRYPENPNAVDSSKPDVMAELIAALKFYRDNWDFKTNKHYGGLEYYPRESLLDDCGNLARETLIKIGSAK